MQHQRDEYHVVTSTATDMLLIQHNFRQEKEPRWPLALNKIILNITLKSAGSVCHCFFHLSFQIFLALLKQSAVVAKRLRPHFCQQRFLAQRNGTLTLCLFYSLRVD